jgi:hypothetical protein
MMDALQLLAARGIRLRPSTRASDTAANDVWHLDRDRSVHAGTGEVRGKPFPVREPEPPFAPEERRLRRAFIIAGGLIGAAVLFAIDPSGNVGGWLGWGR